jgi:hypothetical protein
VHLKDQEISHASHVPLLLVRPRHEEALPEDFHIPQFKSLLMPLDGSVFAAQALAQAKTLAASLNAGLTPVSVVAERPTLMVQASPHLVLLVRAKERLQEPQPVRATKTVAPASMT